MTRKTLDAMLKWARKKLYQRARKPLAKHGNETAQTLKRIEG